MPIKVYPSQPWKRPFPVRMYRTVALPGTFSRGLSRIMAIAIFCVMLPHRQRDRVRWWKFTVSTVADVYNMRAKGPDIEDEEVCLLFLRALPDESSVFYRARPFTTGKIVEIIQNCPSCLCHEAGQTRRGKCGKVSGKNKDVGAVGGYSNDKDSGACGSNESPSGKQDGTRCSICKETGHKRFKFSKLVCSICRETGYYPNSCSQAVKYCSEMTWTLSANTFK